MSKLRARLSDPLRSGVYRARHDDDIRNALAGGSHELAAVELGAGKDAMLQSIGVALGFPEWFGGNWDALEDSLTDLSWRRDAPNVVLFSGAIAGDDFGILVDILASAAEFWREQGRGFFAVFIDPEGKLPLPGLYNEKAA